MIPSSSTGTCFLRQRQGLLLRAPEGERAAGLARWR